MDHQVLARTLASGFCPEDYQQMLNGFAQKLYVSIPSTELSLVVSATKPTDTNVVWYQLDSFGRPLRLYVFAFGAWLALHPQAPGFIMPWFDDLPDFTTFDGGDANAISPISGPMWAVVTDSDVVARFPLATGTLPSGLVVAQGDTGGEEDVELTIPELPAHSHEANTGDTTADDGGGVHVTSGGPNAPHDPVELEVEDTGEGEAHNNMPPWRGMSWLRRTARLYYAVS